jgi:hypothetical protein
VPTRGGIAAILIALICVSPGATARLKPSWTLFSEFYHYLFKAVNHILGPAKIIVFFMIMCLLFLKVEGMIKQF